MSYPSKKLAAQPGENGKQVEIQNQDGWIKWNYVGDQQSYNLISVADLTGNDGRDVRIRVSNGIIQWQNVGDANWQTLIPVADITPPVTKIDIGQTSTLPAGSDAIATITGEAPNLMLNIGIPKGIPGRDGNPGVDGKGISSSSVNYQLSSSGSTPPSGQWSTTIPSITKGQYLWAKTVMVMSDGSSITIYSVSYSGSDGSPGMPGAPGSNGASYTPQSPLLRIISVATAYQHTDTTKGYKVMVSARATQTVTMAGTIGDKIELRIGPSVASVSVNGSGGFSVGVWESGITGIAVMIGAAVADGGQLTADVPAGWYFSVNRLAGTSATIVSCFTQSLTP